MARPSKLLTLLLLPPILYEAAVLVALALTPVAENPELAALNAGVYVLFMPLSAVLIISLLYFWLVRFGVREVRLWSIKFDRFLQFLSEPLQKTISTIMTISLFDTAGGFKILSRPRLLLGVSLVVSTVLAYLPYRSNLNPTGQLVGVDSQLYVQWISAMLLQPWSGALQYAFVQGLYGSRPLLLVALYAIANAGVSPSTVIEYLPMALGPSLSLSNYIFVRYGQGSARLAGISSLFTPFSFYTTVGLWGGYYANWLALIFTFLFATTLLLFSKKPSVRNCATMYAFSVALFLSHVWTWVLVMTVSFAFATSVWRETRDKLHLQSIIGVIAAGGVLDIIKSIVFATRTVAADMVTKSPGGVGSLLSFWNNLVHALLFTHNGLMANWLILGLGALATFKLRFEDKFERLLLLWVAISSIPFLIVDSYTQSRITYELPTPTLVAIGILLVTTLGVGRLRWPGLVIFLSLLISASYTLRGILQV